MSYRNANSRRTRSYRRSGQAWNPARLAPYAWYDVHLGGTSSTITDSSGNGRTAATYGATTAAPLYLPFTGAAYLHLEAATSGTNSLSCTAPANTASYAAYPLGGGAATTGAASSGAFAFTTAGDWTQLDLLNGSGTVLASFRASDSGQTGHTDAYSVAWTINRGTAGGKSTLVNSRSLALLRTNDNIAVPIDAVPDFSTTTGTVVVVCRVWNTPTASQVIFGTNALLLRMVGTAMQTRASYGATSATNGAHTAGARIVLAGGYEPGTTTVFSRVNAAAETTGTVAAGAADTLARIGSSAGGSAFADIEFEALLTFTGRISAAGMAQLVTYYGGGL